MFEDLDLKKLSEGVIDEETAVEEPAVEETNNKDGGVEDFKDKGDDKMLNDEGVPRQESGADAEEERISQIADDELSNLLKMVTETSEVAATAEEQLEASLEQDNIERIRADYEEVKAARDDLDMRVKDLQSKLEMSQTELQRAIDEKTLAEYQNSTQNKLLKHVENDPWLKALSVYKYKFDADWSNKSEYIDVLKDMLKDASGIDVDGLLDEVRVAGAGIDWAEEGAMPWPSGETTGLNIWWMMFD